MNWSSEGNIAYLQMALQRVLQYCHNSRVAEKWSRLCCFSVVRLTDGLLMKL